MITIDGYNNIILTVVTVCFNAEKCIRRTIESVLQQNYSMFEYLIIDGGSEDSTICIAKEYETKFLNKGIQYRVFSEKDDGIYDAMNKAARIASGLYIIYLNADDEFCTSEVIKNFYRIVTSMDKNIDVYYGDYIRRYNQLCKYEKAKDISYFHISMPFCHQSVFTRVDLLKERPYDISFHLFADHDFYLWCYISNKEFCYIGLPVVFYDAEGTSSKASYYQQKEEHFRIHLKNKMISNEEYLELLKKEKNKSFIYNCRKRTQLLLKRIMPKIYIKYRNMHLIKVGYSSNVLVDNTETCSDKIRGVL